MGKNGKIMKVEVASPDLTAFFEKVLSDAALLAFCEETGYVRRVNRG